MLWMLWRGSEAGREAGREGGSEDEMQPFLGELGKKARRMEGGREGGTEEEGCVFTWVLLAVSPMRLL